MKGNSIMKAMRYILMVISVVGVLSVYAQPQTEQPQVQFQSTSTLQGSGSTYSSTPTLNTNGTANTPASAPVLSGPKRSGALPPPPVVEEGDTGNTPIGDAVIPLLAFALMFCGYIAIRRKREAR